MSQINDFKELVEGREYNIHCKPLNVTNKARFISHDTTILKRDITYWQFSERNYPIVTRDKLRLMFKDDDYPITVFALWGFDLRHNIITETN